MCLIILVNKEFLKAKADRYFEWKKAGRERRRDLLHKVRPCLRPAATVDEGVQQQKELHIKDAKPPQYASETSLLLNKEVVG